MSHGFIKETDTMFSVKERPWHGLGKVIQEAPTIEEGIKLAGLDWDVKLQGIRTNSSISIQGHKAVIRTDNNDCLGMVKEGYNPLQNTEAFKFFEPFIENKLATLETAGCLFGGKKVFILAKLNSDNLVVSKDDEIEKYVLLSNSHDGSQALKIGFTPIRVVCNNTLTMAENNEASKLIRVTHKRDIVQSITELRETMDLVNQQFLATEEQYKYLASRNVNLADLHKYVKQVFSLEKLEELYDKEADEIAESRKKLIARIEEIFELEPVHNAWTMYNSVNYYLNHERGRNLESRYNHMWFGHSKRYDRRALKLATKY